MAGFIYTKEIATAVCYGTTSETKNAGVFSPHYPRIYATCHKLIAKQLRAPAAHSWHVASVLAMMEAVVQFNIPRQNMRPQLMHRSVWQLSNSDLRNWKLYPQMCPHTQILSHFIILQAMENWTGSEIAWLCESLTLWELDSVRAWLCESLTLSELDSVKAWPCESLTLWEVDSLAEKYGLVECRSLICWISYCTLYKVVWNWHFETKYTATIDAPIQQYDTVINVT